MSSRVWPAAGGGELQIERYRPTDPETGNPIKGQHVQGLVNFSVGPAVLTMLLLRTNKFAWSYADPQQRIEGGGVDWSHGRVVCAGKDGVTCFQIIRDRMGLTFGQVEIEFRELTGYKE